MIRLKSVQRDTASHPLIMLRRNRCNSPMWPQPQIAHGVLLAKVQVGTNDARWMPARGIEQIDHLLGHGMIPKEGAQPALVNVGACQEGRQFCNHLATQGVFAQVLVIVGGK